MVSSSASRRSRSTCRRRAQSLEPIVGSLDRDARNRSARLPRQRPHHGARLTWMSSSRIFLRSVLRLRPSTSAALSWLPRVAASARAISGRSTSRDQPIVDAGRRQCRRRGRGSSGRCDARSPHRKLSSTRAVSRHRRRRAAPARSSSAITVLADRVLGVEHGQAPHEVLELADVAGPGMRLQPHHRLGRQRLQRQAVGLRPRQEMLRQGRDVVDPLAQRRQAHGHHVQPIEQILAEQALADHQPQVAMAGGDDPDVGADRVDGRRPATNSPCCSTRSSRVWASSGMSPISSRNSVPPSACSNRPGAPGAGAGERALLVAEQLALDQLARDCRHVDGDERPAACACRNRAAPAPPAPCRCRTSPAIRTVRSVPISRAMIR